MSLWGGIMYFVNLPQLVENLKIILRKLLGHSTKNTNRY